MAKASKTRWAGEAIEKECTKCAQWKPAVLKYFAGFKAGVMGLHPWCRECLRQYIREKQARTGKPVRKNLADFGAPPKVQNPIPKSVAKILAAVTQKIAERARFKAYLITNSLNGKNYVGITERKLKDRWKQHLMDGTKGGGYLLHKVMHRDGIENFTFEFIACAIDRHSLHLLEVQLIDQYRAVELGYNQTRGGAAGESVGTEMRVDGKTFISISSAAREFGVDEDKAFQRLTRHGWTPEQTFGLAPAPARKGRKTLFEFGGKTFDNFVAACSAYGFDEPVVRARLKRGWSDRQAFGVEPAPVRTNTTGRSVQVSGEQFRSIAEAAKRFGVRPHGASKRIKKGLTPEQAFLLAAAPKPEWAGKAIVINGVTYRSVATAARKLGVDARLAAEHLRKGWTVEQTFGLSAPKPRATVSTGEEIEVNDVVYSSHAQAAKAIGLGPKIVHKRLKQLGWTRQQAFGLEPPPTKSSNSAKTVVVGGTSFDTRADACAAFGITQSTVNRRVASGMSLEEALTKPSRKAKGRKLCRAGL